MARKGKRQIPNHATEHILAAIASLTTEEFIPGDIVQRVPDINRHTVYRILQLKKKQGALRSVGYARYSRGGISIPLVRISAGVASDAVWTVLFTDPERRFWRCRRVAGEMEGLIGRPEYDGLRSTSAILSSWYRDGFLERKGRRGEYGYRLKPGITERPLTKRG